MVKHQNMAKMATTFNFVNPICINWAVVKFHLIFLHYYLTYFVCAFNIIFPWQQVMDTGNITVRIMGLLGILSDF